eukprot:gnl/MRDRNA2_/MRDRNA2_86584_c2_seq9.p1 gnl/MRDRNA2_/MRDRNA2_86584_c2~~gnl/MRDRNA2_/MRDRNA2_86584_c2_seq9.p1  ORF type:complete len:123 (-),score=12.15 gnl/MRDRNA2_/MRDRNA2_86584_c2_seq9:208-576(-)
MVSNTQSSPARTNHDKNFQNLPQIIKNSVLNPPKSSRIPPKIDSKSLQKASWSPSRANAEKKLDFERPRNGQEPAKSAQKRPKTVPNPSKMEPKTIPRQILVRFLGVFFQLQICIDFLFIFS